MGDFDITLGYEFGTNQTLCHTKNGQVKIATSTSTSEYECFSCTEKVKGSFLFIINKVKDREIEICDLNVEGSFVSSSRKFFLLQFSYSNFLC